MPDNLDKAIAKIAAVAHKHKLKKQQAGGDWQINPDWVEAPQAPMNGQELAMKAQHAMMVGNAPQPLANHQLKFGKLQINYVQLDNPNVKQPPDNQGFPMPKHPIPKDELIKPTMDPEAPAKSIVSIFGGSFPSSRKQEWEFYPEIGWLHKTEKHLWDHCYSRCVLSGKWSNRNDCLSVMDDNGSKAYARREEISKAKMVQCISTGCWLAPEFCHKGLNGSRGVEYISIHAVGDKKPTFICDFDHKTYLSAYAVCIKGHDTYKVVSSYHIHNGGPPFLKCEACGSRRWHEHMLPDGNCPDCNAKKQAGQYIRPWDHSSHPDIISPMVKRRGHVVRGGHIFASGKEELVPTYRPFGVEIEVELDIKVLKKNRWIRGHVAKNLMDRIGSRYIVIKEDGSLTLNGKYSGAAEFAQNGDGPNHAGFEIVSCPMGLDSHRSVWGMLDRCEVFGALRSWDTPTCGFHVHFSREAITNLQLGKMLVFINHKKNRKFLREVAGRGGNKYCVYADKNFSDSLHPERVVSASEKQDRDRRRRVALNVCNKHTIEYRGFKGTVNPRHIIRNIEFCDALIEFTYPGETTPIPPMQGGGVASSSSSINEGEDLAPAVGMAGGSGLHQGQENRARVPPLTR